MQANQTEVVKVRHGNTLLVPEAVKLATKIGQLSLVELLRLRQVNTDFRSFIDTFFTTNFGFRVLWNYGLAVQYNSRHHFRQIKRFRQKFGQTALMQREGKTLFVGDNADLLFDTMLLNIPYPRVMADLVGMCQLFDIDCADPELEALSKPKKRLFQLFVWGRTETKRRDASKGMECFLRSLEKKDAEDRILLKEAEVVLAEDKYRDDKYNLTRAVLNSCVIAAFNPQKVPKKAATPFYVRFVHSNLSGEFVNRQFSFVNLHGLQFNQVRFVSNDFTGAVFSSCAFSASVCENQDFSGLNFQASRLHGVKFINSNLNDCDFREANIQGCTFKNTDINGVNFARAKLAFTEILQANPFTKFVCFDAVRWIEEEAYAKVNVAVLLERPDIFEYSNLIFSLPLDKCEGFETVPFVQKSLACLETLLNRCDSVEALISLWYHVFQRRFGVGALATLFSKPLDLLSAMTLFVDACERVTIRCNQSPSLIRRLLLQEISPRCEKTMMGFHEVSINEAWSKLKIRVEQAMPEKLATPSCSVFVTQ